MHRMRAETQPVRLPRGLFWSHMAALYRGVFSLSFFSYCMHSIRLGPAVPMQSGPAWLRSRREEECPIKPPVSDRLDDGLGL